MEDKGSVKATMVGFHEQTRTKAIHWHVSTCTGLRTTQCSCLERKWRYAGSRGPDREDRVFYAGHSSLAMSGRRDQHGMAGKNTT
eukprot:359453-Chlamydomonas_euryale.AAC.9